MKLTNLYKTRKEELLQQLKAEYKNKTLYVLPVDEDVKGDLLDIMIFNDMQNSKEKRNYRLTLEFTKGTTSLYYDEMSKLSAIKIIKLMELTKQFIGAINLIINESIKLYNVQPSKIEEYLKDVNSPYTLKQFIDNYKNNQGFIEFIGLNEEEVDVAIKTMVNSGGKDEA